MLMWLTGQWKQKSSKERKRYRNGEKRKKMEKVGKKVKEQDE